jgi:hypothetical protein
MQAMTEEKISAERIAKLYDVPVELLTISDEALHYLFHQMGSESDWPNMHTVQLGQWEDCDACKGEGCEACGDEGGFWVTHPPSYTITDQAGPVSGGGTRP